MKKWIIVLFVLISQVSWAALPPLVQSAKEIDAILQSEELYTHLSSGELILQIRRLPEASGTRYEVVTNYSRLIVDCIYKESRRAGPAEFELLFHDRNDES